MGSLIRILRRLREELEDIDENLAINQTKADSDALFADRRKTEQAIERIEKKIWK